MYIHGLGDPGFYFIGSTHPVDNDDDRAALQRLYT